MKKLKKNISESETWVNINIQMKVVLIIFNDESHIFIFVSNQISDLNSLFPKTIFPRLTSEAHERWDICIQKDLAILSRDYVLKISSSDLTFIGELTKVLQEPRGGEEYFEKQFSDLNSLFLKTIFTRGCSGGDLLRSVRFIRVWHFKFDFL